MITELQKLQSKLMKSRKYNKNFIVEGKQTIKKEIANKKQEI